MLSLVLTHVFQIAAASQPVTWSTDLISTVPDGTQDVSHSWQCVAWNFTIFRSSDQKSWADDIRDATEVTSVKQLVRTVLATMPGSSDWAQSGCLGPPLTGWRTYLPLLGCMQLIKLKLTQPHSTHVWLQLLYSTLLLSAFSCCFLHTIVSWGGRHSHKTKILFKFFTYSVQYNVVVFLTAHALRGLQRNWTSWSNMTKQESMLYFSALFSHV